MRDVGGVVDKGFGGVRDAFAQAQAGDEGGAQLCVYRHGKKVVDLWAGRDRVNDRPYTDQTLAILMSCSKGAVATMAHMLVERGLLDLDAPVTKYWPEFGQAGKKDVPVSYLLSHRVGLTGFEPDSGVGPPDLFDWHRCTAAPAAMTPLWAPVTAYTYHSLTHRS